MAAPVEKETAFGGNLNVTGRKDPSGNEKARQSGRNHLIDRADFGCGRWI
jgi:hypothetical protein